MRGQRERGAEFGIDGGAVDTVFLEGDMTQRLQAQWLELEERREPERVDWEAVKRDGRWRKAVRWLVGGVEWPPVVATQVRE